MAQTMTPSVDVKTTTPGQIDKAVANYRALLEKHAGDFQAEAVQMVLGLSELAGEMFALFRRRVESISNKLVHTVSVNRTLTPQQALDATSRRQYTDPNVVASMPRGEGDQVVLYYFDLDYDPTPTELQAEYDKRSLKADPIAQAADNAANPSFADQRPNCCQWGLDENGVASFAAFHYWHDERRVSVHRRGNGWRRNDRFGGVRK